MAETAKGSMRGKVPKPVPQLSFILPMRRSTSVDTIPDAHLDISDGIEAVANTQAT